MSRSIRLVVGALLLGLVSLVLAVGGAPAGPNRAAAATCSDYANQAAAQAAKDTRDGNGDGVYCEGLPCPCAGKTDPEPEAPKEPPAPARPRGSDADPENCVVVRKVVAIGLSRTKYPAVRAHWERAIKTGWPRVLTIHRKGAAKRRAKLLAGMPTRRGKDRDEYPMAMARTSVKADVEYVDSGQNRGAGSAQGVKLRRYCSGQRFKIVWY